MSSQQGAWQTAGRQRQSQSASRTPQNRSGAGSPSQQAQSTHPIKTQQQVNNAWTSNAASSNGSAVAQQEDVHQPVNVFNTAEVKAFLGREGAVTAYKPTEASGGNRNSGGAWGSKPGNMANNQPFFVQLAKQIATLEGGG